MYSFQPSPEQHRLIETVRRFAAQELRPAARAADESGEWPSAVIQRGMQLGLTQVGLTDADGDGDSREQTALNGTLAAEVLAYGDLAGALAILMPNLFAVPVAILGSDVQKAEFLADISIGDEAEYTAALIELDWDFDACALKTTAIRDGDHYLLTGVKAYVPAADKARTMLVYAALEGETQAFIVEAEAEGVVVGARQKLLGLNGFPLFGVELKDVRVDKSKRLDGDFGLVWARMQTTWAAMGVGLAQAAFDYARDYAKEREVFGSKVAQKQSIAFMLAEMATEIEAIRLVTWQAAWQAAWQLDEGDIGAGHTAYLAHMGAGELAMRGTDRAVQILGGHGYVREHPVEMWMRNGRAIASLTGLAVV
ncbi:MAG: acyl-CoA dehydrogenase [Chloroflexi bacterium]|nr:acyl-CoA dehydrogenase [Chloroflexota bacterium]